MSTVYELSREGQKLRTERDAPDLIGETFHNRAEWIVIPVERLDPDFFQLETTVAGLFLQKIVNYHRNVSIVGDISQHLAASTALRDFVIESNRGGRIWFVQDKAELDHRLSARA